MALPLRSQRAGDDGLRMSVSRQWPFASTDKRTYQGPASMRRQRRRARSSDQDDHQYGWAVLTENQNGHYSGAKHAPADKRSHRTCACGERIAPLDGQVLVGVAVNSSCHFIVIPDIFGPTSRPRELVAVDCAQVLGPLKKANIIYQLLVGEACFACEPRLPNSARRAYGAARPTGFR